MTRWGVLATGGIAATVAGDLAAVEGAELLAVASRGPERAAAFAAEHGVARSYGSYADLLADPDVDVVYVATPHGLHREVAGAALRAGKPVLVEKSFTTTTAGARELVDLARERGLFCMEAMWTRFQPAVVEVLGLLADGVVGDVRHVAADLGFRVPPGTARFVEPSLGGGALLDMGVYPVSLAHMVLGAPDEVVARGTLAPSGVDAEATLLLSYPTGATAALHTTMVGAPPRRGAVVGTEGHVLTEGGALHRPDAFVVHRTGEEPRRVEHAQVGRGYGPMLRHVQECLAQGLTESPVWPLSSTLAVLDVLERSLHQLGVVMDDAPRAG